MEANRNFSHGQQQMQEESISCYDIIDSENKQNKNEQMVQILEPKFPQSTQSQFHIDYRSYLRRKNVSFHSISKHHILDELRNTEIEVSFNSKTQFSEQIIFQNIQTNQHIKIFTVKIGPFRQKIHILLENRKSPFHDNNSCAYGCFGTVYTIPNSPTNKKSSFVIKCIKINQKKPQILKFHIREYFFTNLFSYLAIGPKSDKQFGFDMILWQDCIEFTLEKCSEIKLPVKHNPNNSKDLFNILASKLYKMHQLNIVHLDIKPRNILFSQFLQEPVFIDFGCTKYIQQRIGSFSVSSFVGTYEYASFEMKKIFLCGKGSIDLYHNDVYSLKHTEETVLLQGKVINLGQYYTDRNQTFLLSKYLQIKLIQFKYHLHMNQKEKLKHILDQIMNSEKCMIDALLYVSHRKSSYEMRQCFETIHPYISKVKKLYDDQGFKRVNIVSESSNRFMNVYDLIDFLQLIFIKKTEHNLNRSEQKEQKQRTEQLKYVQAFQVVCSTENEQKNEQNKSLFHKHFQSEKDFCELYESMNKAENIEKIKVILMSKESISRLSTENYFFMFLNCIDFTKNRGVHLTQKINFARVFCQVCQKNSLNEKSEESLQGPEQIQDKFDELKRSMDILVKYCTSSELTVFKLMFFSKICSQVILIHSTAATRPLQDLNYYIRVWLQMLVKDNNYKLLQKYSEAYMVFQSQYIVEVTQLYIFNYEIVDEETVKNFLRDIKQGCEEWAEQQMIISQLYEWLIMSLYSIDAGLIKSRQMRRRLQTNFQIQTPLRSYLLKKLTLTTYATEILLGHIRDIKKINHFEEILSNLHREVKENKYFTNSELQVFIFKCKIFRLAVKKFHYQKGAVLLKQIEKEVNCEDMTEKMFLTDKCYMMRRKSLTKLAEVIRRLSEMEDETLQGVNYDFLNMVIEVLKHKVYNVYLQRHESIPAVPYREIEGQLLRIVRIKQGQFEARYVKTKRVYYYWLQTLYKLITASEFHKRQCFSVYESYYRVTIKHNKGYYYRLNFIYNKLKVEQFYAYSLQKMCEVATLFELELMGQIERILDQRDYQFVEWKGKREHDQGMHFLQIDQVLNLYFKAVISVVNVAILGEGDLSKKQSILLKLVKISEEHHHYISFFEGYSLVFDVLIALTNHAFQTINQSFLSDCSTFNTLKFITPEDKNFQSNQLIQAKSVLWNFIFNLSINLTQLADPDFQIEYLKQIQQFFLQIQTQFIQSLKKIPNCNYYSLINHQIIDLAEFFYQCTTQIQEIHMQKHNGLVVFQIFASCLKKIVSGLNVVKEKKHLWKLTRCLEFLRSFLKRQMVSKYYSLFTDKKQKNISFRQFFHIYVQNNNKLAIQKYCDAYLVIRNSKINKMIESRLKQKMKRYEQNSK